MSLHVYWSHILGGYPRGCCGGSGVVFHWENTLLTPGRYYGRTDG